MTLREWIEGQDKGQRELAEGLGVHPVTLSRWLHGRLMPSRAALLRIRTLTDGQVTADSFLRPDLFEAPAPQPEAVGAK